MPGSPTSLESPEFKTLRKVLLRLDEAKIPYMLTGSMALNFYGHPRATNDFDIVITIQRFQKKNFVDLFQPDFYISEEAVEDAMTHHSLFNVIDNESIFKVDFIIKKNDILSNQQFQRRSLKALGALNAYVISPEDLILAKLEWSAESLSEMQERDIRGLLRLLSSALDHEYLEKWADHIGQLDRLRSLYA
ncbi:MAG: hypothetical protein HY540_03970 [Deltaproteobacteria bacterium]|nr:hypothetical protein [Deltaproteobacteria bacterium]